MFSPKSFVGYRIVTPLPSIEHMQESIEQHVAQPLDARAKESIGFTAPPRMDTPLPDAPQHSVLVQGRFLIVCALHQNRKVPPEAVQEALDKWLAQQTDEPKASVIREKKQEIRDELIPKYPPIETRINGCIDIKAKRIVWENKKIDAVERLNGRLSQTDDFSAHAGMFPLNDSGAIESALTDLLKEKTPQPLALGSECILSGPEKETAAFKNCDIENADEVSTLIKDGFVVKKLALVQSLSIGCAQFTITPDLVIAGWKLLDEEGDAAKATAIDDGFAQQCLAQMKAFNQVLESLHQCLKNNGVDVYNTQSPFINSDERAASEQKVAAHDNNGSDPGKAPASETNITKNAPGDDPANASSNNTDDNVEEAVQDTVDSEPDFAVSANTEHLPVEPLTVPAKETRH